MEDKHRQGFQKKQWAHSAPKCELIMNAVEDELQTVKGALTFPFSLSKSQKSVPLK